VSKSDGALYLAIDQGSHASRALVFDEQGHIQAHAREEITTLKPQPGWIEHDPEEILAALRNSVREIERQLGEDAGRIECAGIATQRSSVVCWDRDAGRPLSNVISWQDRRAAEWLRGFAHASERVHAITGLVLSPHYGVSKLRWCLDELDAVRDCFDQGRLAFGPLSSFLLQRLLDEPVPVADPANASRTLVWDYRQRDWSDELLDLFGLPLNALPKSVPSRYAHGALQIGAHDVPLVLATGDQSAALFGFGGPTPVTVHVNLGTGAFLQQVVGPEPFALPGLLSSVVYQDQAQSVYVLEGTVNGAGSAILKIADELGMDRAYMKANSAKWLDEVTDPPLFLNGVGGLGAPYWIADFPTRFVGDGDDREKISAVIESIVFLLAVNLEAFALHDPAPERLVVTGGLAAIDPLCQRLAELTGLQVIRPQEQEATAQGLAYLLANQPPRWFSAGTQDSFSARDSGPINKRYKNWRDAMQDAMDALT